MKKTELRKCKIAQIGLAKELLPCMLALIGIDMVILTNAESLSRGRVMEHEAAFVIAAAKCLEKFFMIE